MSQNTFEFLVSKLDFKDLKTSLANYIKSKPEYSDYNFEAATLNIITDLLAYNTQQNAWLANMIANEMFLDTAILRDSVVSNAQHIGYTPHSSKSAKGQVKVEFFPNDNPALIFIPLGTEFSGKSTKNTNLRFTADKSYTIVKDSDDRYIGYIDLIEGKRLQHKWVVNTSSNQNFIIPNDNIDIDSLVVRVQQGANSVIQTQFNKADNIVRVSSDEPVYWVNETLDGTFQLKFGDGIVGKPLETDNIIIVNYIVNTGSGGNGAKNFTANGVISNYTGTTYITTQIAGGGSDKESISSIKKYAPRNFETQNRVIVEKDYETLIKRFYPNAETISVWGGQKNNPPQYGKVFISVKPVGGTKLNEIEISELKNNLEMYNFIAIPVEYVIPEIFNIIIDTTVKYNSDRTTTTEGALKIKVLSEILNFSAANLNAFGSYFRFSNLSKIIDAADPGISSNLSVVKLKKRLYPKLNVKSFYEIQFNNAIKVSNIEKGLHSISSTPFVYKGQDCKLEDDGNGVLYIYRIISGTKVKINQEAGTVDYGTGKIELNEFVPEDVVGQPAGEEFIDIIIEPKFADLEVLRNNILEITTDNVNINLINESI